MRQTLHVEVVYAEPGRQLVVPVEVPSGATLGDAVEVALPQLQASYPTVDFATLATGIWGEAADRAKVLQEADRAELYRPLVADPKLARRTRADLTIRRRPPGSVHRR